MPSSSRRPRNPDYMSDEIMQVVAMLNNDESINALSDVVLDHLLEKMMATIPMSAERASRATSLREAMGGESDASDQPPRVSRTDDEDVDEMAVGRHNGNESDVEELDASVLDLFASEDEDDEGIPVVDLLDQLDAERSPPATGQRRRHASRIPSGDMERPGSLTTAIFMSTA